jgi:hypothetical protein
MTQPVSRTQGSITTATRRIESYRKRFGDSHIYLACYAALPLALTPDLLYRLWANFQRDIRGELLEIPWIAVSDLLLSNLCEEVGEELYEMEDGVREVLLKQLRSLPQMGEARLKAVAEFVLAYVEPQLNDPDLDVRDLAEMQQWRSLAYVEPESAARSIALRLSQLDHEDKSEWLRMARLVEPLGEPLMKFGPLVDYTRGMAAFVRGRMAETQKHLKKALGVNRELEVAGVRLPLPKKILSALQPDIQTVVPKQSFWELVLENSRWLGAGATVFAMLGGGIFYWGRSQKPNNPRPTITPSLSSNPNPPSSTSLNSLISPTPNVIPGSKKSPSPVTPADPSINAKPKNREEAPRSKSKVSPSPTSIKQTAASLPNNTGKSIESPRASNSIASSPAPTSTRINPQPVNPSPEDNDNGLNLQDSKPTEEVKNLVLPGNSKIVARGSSGKVNATLDQNQSNINIQNSEGKLITSLPLDGGHPNDIKVSPDDNMIAAISLDNTIKIWTINGRLVKEVKNNSKITSFEFALDSQSLIYVTDDVPMTVDWKTAPGGGL